MRILHVVEDFSSVNTGITAVVGQQTAWQAQCYEWIGIFATGASDVSFPIGVNFFYDKNFKYPLYWRRTHGLEDRLKCLILDNRVQLVHIHGLWRAASLIAQKVCAFLGVKTVLTVHGQLEPWALNGQGVVKKWKKKLYLHIAAKAFFKHTSLLHAITLSEQKSLQKIFPLSSSVVVPNAINLEDVPTGLSPVTWEDLPRTIVYLGRLHPVKGLDILIRVFMDIADSSAWRLVIAGPQEIPAYAEELKKMVSGHHLEGKIEFVGPVYGYEKWQLLANAWVVAVPSFSEVVGMVNLEAASSNTPTITTFQTGLLDWQEGGGLLIEPQEDDLRQGLLRAMAWSEKERQERGRQCRLLVENRYSLNAVKIKWQKLYHSLVSSK